MEKEQRVRGAATRRQDQVHSEQRSVLTELLRVLLDDLQGHLGEHEFTQVGSS